MKKSLFTIALALIGFAGFSQTTVGSHQVNITISEVTDVALANTTAVGFSYTDAAAITADAASQQTKLIDIQANYDWELNAYLGADFAHGTTSSTIPASVLSINGNAMATGAANAVQIATDDAGTYDDTSISYDVALGTNKWSYESGAYSATVTFTLTKQ